VSPPEKLVFLDLETMGTLPSSPIVQIGMLVAERVGSTLCPAVAWECLIPYSERDWAMAHVGAASMHEASGLRARSVEEYRRTRRDQGGRPALSVASEAAIEFLGAHGFGQNQAIIAGNSVGQDRVWLATQMPRLHSYLHHRMVDVSSFRVIASMFRDVPVPPKSHTAVADCQSALDELNGYMGRFA